VIIFYCQTNNISKKLLIKPLLAMGCGSSNEEVKENKAKGKSKPDNVGI
jgi:hypothetical protein